MREEDVGREGTTLLFISSGGGGGMAAEAGRFCIMIPIK
jgi:hypothetical protein